MDFQVDEQSDQVVVTIRGEFDAKSAPLVRDRLDALVAAQRSKVLVDLSGLRLIDSTGVGALVSVFKRTRAYGGEFKVTGLQGQPRSIFELLRLDRVLT